ncbi:hypothetical protein BOTBODRAFT_540507 [Botryobasidium botryosum FD-172 SS1]|uniref:Zn(2)-C6 fungal-type domain-containing protein n=1 Tax=Botryobasidium botryosum (strain FD-172 SS1) TaxID=930990 RepID=A0A067MAS0_BOTB1|nr:hypothetical protein BOTBODRAFT_540507 [Botryobasidium botryosum FD-172 SS1]
MEVCIYTVQLVQCTSVPRAKVNRVRKGAACSACHAKKRRCNAARPKCSGCARNSEQECIYAAEPPKTKTVLLQQRVEDLEAQETHELPAPLMMPVYQRIDPLIGSWWSMGQPPPSGLISLLVSIFIRGEHQQTHDPRPPEFYESLYDHSPDTGLHPALRNAIFLWSCTCDHLKRLSRLEPLFLRRTLYYLNESLARADRLLDFIEAHILLAMYYLDRERYIQGVRDIAATMAFAVACGLHALRPPTWHPSNSTSLLPRTQCRVEIQRRVRRH